MHAGVGTPHTLTGPRFNAERLYQRGDFSLLWWFARARAQLSGTSEMNARRLNRRAFAGKRALSHRIVKVQVDRKGGRSAFGRASGAHPRRLVKPSELICLAFVHGSCTLIVSQCDRRVSLSLFLSLFIYLSRTRCRFQEARRKVAIVSRDVISRICSCEDRLRVRRWMRACARVRLHRYARSARARERESNVHKE